MSAEPGSSAPEAVPISRVTVVAAEPFADVASAAGWLRSCNKRDAAAVEIEEALRLVNLAVGAHRVAAHDPYARDLSVSDIQRVRLGFGTGGEIVDGTWREAVTIPDAPAVVRPRRRMLSPDEEMAGMLSGRRPLGQPSEELLVRARLDLNHGRTVEAALMAHAATRALAAEGHGGDEPDAARLAESALAGGLSPAETEELTELVRRVERAVRRRRYADAS